MDRNEIWSDYQLFFGCILNVSMIIVLKSQFTIVIVIREPNSINEHVHIPDMYKILANP